MEAGIAAQLEAAGVEYEYESISLDYTKRVPRGVCDDCGSTKTAARKRYTPDFIPSGTKVVLEVKGYFKPSERAKMLAVRSANPTWELRMVFGADNKLNKKKNERYSDWCRKHEFKYAVRILPPKWLGEWGGAAESGNDPRREEA